MTQENTTQAEIIKRFEAQSKGVALISIIFGMLVILAVVAGVYYFGKTTNKTEMQTVVTTKPAITASIDETSNWKTYTNPNYKLSISYPESWNFSTKNYLNNIKDYIIFSIYEDTLSSSRLELYKDFQGGFCEGSSDMKNTKVELNGGITGNKIECLSTISINFQKDGNNLWLIATKVNDKNRDVFNKIIASLTFLK